MIEKKSYFKQTDERNSVIKVLRVGDRYVAYNHDKNVALHDKLMCHTAIEQFLTKNGYVDVMEQLRMESR